MKYIRFGIGCAFFILLYIAMLVASEYVEIPSISDRFTNRDLFAIVCLAPAFGFGGIFGVASVRDYLKLRKNPENNVKGFPQSTSPQDNPHRLNADLPEEEENPMLQGLPHISPLTPRETTLAKILESNLARMAASGNLEISLNLPQGSKISLLGQEWEIGSGKLTIGSKAQEQTTREPQKKTFPILKKPEA